MLNTKEHYDLMIQFEKDFKYKIEREDRNLWRNGVIYQNGETNNLFLAYRIGYTLGKAIWRE